MTGVGRRCSERCRHHCYDRRQRRTQEPGQAVQRAARPARQARRRCLVQRHQPAARRQAEADLQRDRHLDARNPGQGHQRQADHGQRRQPRRLLPEQRGCRLSTPTSTVCSTGLTDALGTLRSQASDFGSNLSIVENRTDFTKAMINTLETGADNLVLADTERGGRQPARPADPPAALLHGPVARLAGRPGRAAAVRLADTTSRSVRRRRNHDTAAFFTVR